MSFTETNQEAFTGKPEMNDRIAESKQKQKKHKSVPTPYKVLLGNLRVLNVV